MKQFTVTLPDGWILKFLLFFFAILFFAIFLPWWAIKLDSMRTLEQARTSAAARELSSQCPVQ